MIDLTEKTVKKNPVFKGKIFTAYSDDVLDATGKKCKREIVEHSGGAAVLYEAEGKILFVWQYRYAYGETVLEIPAGKLEKGEDPKAAALRELSEEGGVVATDAELICTLYPSPGYTNEKIYIYLAKNGEQKNAHPDEGEVLVTEWIEKEEALRLLEEGKLHDAKTVVALQAYLYRK